MGKWGTLLAQLDNDMLTGNWRTASYTHGGRSRTFQSLKEFTDFYTWVEQRANQETSTVVARTYARPRETS